MSEDQTVEEKARAQGWVPEDEYKGKSGAHKTAEEFLEVGKKIGAVQSERNGKLMEQLLKQQDETKQQMKEFADTQKLELAATKKDAYDRAMEDFKKEQLEAVDEGNRDKFLEVQTKIDNTEKPEEVVIEKENKPDPKMVEWAAKNTWYRDSTALRAAADAIAEDILKKGQTSQEDFLGEVTRQMKLEFPDKFNVKAENQDVEDSSSGGGNKTKGKNNYSELPSDAKKACDKYVAQGLYKDKAEYCAEYYA